MQFFYTKIEDPAGEITTLQIWAKDDWQAKGLIKAYFPNAEMQLPKEASEKCSSKEAESDGLFNVFDYSWMVNQREPTIDVQSKKIIGCSFVEAFVMTNTAIQDLATKDPHYRSSEAYFSILYGIKTYLFFNTSLSPSQKLGISRFLESILEYNQSKQCMQLVFPSNVSGLEKGVHRVENIIVLP